MNFVIHNERRGLTILQRGRLFSDTSFARSDSRSPKLPILSGLAIRYMEPRI